MQQVPLAIPVPGQMHLLGEQFEKENLFIFLEVHHSCLFVPLTLWNKQQHVFPLRISVVSLSHSIEKAWENSPYMWNINDSSWAILFYLFCYKRIPNCTVMSRHQQHRADGSIFPHIDSCYSDNRSLFLSFCQAASLWQGMQALVKRTLPILFKWPSD